MATRHYLGIAERAGDGWSISFPAFPGTVTTAGTFYGLLMHARDALSSVVDALQEDGQQVPPGYEEEGAEPIDVADYEDPRFVLVAAEVAGKALRINVTMDEGLVARLDSAASRAQSTRSALLARGARMLLAAEARD